MTTKFDLLVVGGGILGTFHCLSCSEENLKVALLERNSLPQGATVRNFGQVVLQEWILNGKTTEEKALQYIMNFMPRQILRSDKNGSVYIASNDEELQLIEELYEINRNNDYESVLLSKNDCIKKYDGLRSDYCKGGAVLSTGAFCRFCRYDCKLHKLLQERWDYRSFIILRLLKPMKTIKMYCQSLLMERNIQPQKSLSAAGMSSKPCTLMSSMKAIWK